MSESIVRIRAPFGDRDRYGNATRDWDNAARLTIAGCAVAPTRLPEDRDNGREGVTVAFTVYAPQGTDVASTDRVEYRGDEYEVDGEPEVWEHPRTGWKPGVVISIRRTKG